MRTFLTVGMALLFTLSACHQGAKTTPVFGKVLGNENSTTNSNVHATMVLLEKKHCAIVRAVSFYYLLSIKSNDDCMSYTVRASPTGRFDGKLDRTIKSGTHKWWNGGRYSMCVIDLDVLNMAIGFGGGTDGELLIVRGADVAVRVFDENDQAIIAIAGTKHFGF